MFTRVRALLAGALVLGVGATLTLAAWTDDEYARGTFATSVFGIEGSENGSTYASHPSGSPAVLTFSASPNALSPGSTTFAKFLVRTTADSNVTGKVRLDGAVTSGELAPALRYGVKVIGAAATCNQSTYDSSSTAVIPANSILSTGATVLQNVAVAGGSPVAYCFAVTLPAGTDNSLQGKTANATWTFTATSDS